MDYAKVILTAYPYINDAIKNIDKQIERTCRFSFYSLRPCYYEAEKIAELISHKRYLEEMKEKVDKIFPYLTEEERILIGYKFFKNRPIDGFDYKSRRYFRQQVRALTHFSDLLKCVNLSESEFLKIYAKIPYVKSIMSRLYEDKAA